LLHQFERHIADNLQDKIYYTLIKSLTILTIEEVGCYKPRKSQLSTQGRQENRKAIKLAGNTLPEYALIGSLVIVGSVGGLILLGGNLQGEFSSFGQSLKRIQPSQSASGFNLSQIAAQTGLSPSGNSVMYTTRTGAVIALPDYPQPISTTVNTIGANGTTALMANQILKIAQQLLDAGDISEEQYGTLVALANQGHYIAEVERILEAAAAQVTTSEEYESTTVSFNGKEYTMNSLRMLIGFGTGSNNPATIKNPLSDTRAYPEASKFQALYQAAIESGALSDPVSRQIVETLATEIVYLSEVANCTSTEILQNSLTPDQMTQRLTSHMTHRDSSGICREGRSLDNGIQCSG
jgi:Flp pilus assembly pilin Flp